MAPIRDAARCTRSARVAVLSARPVVSLIRTDAGAKLFATQIRRPGPNGFVFFDRNLRYGRPYQSYGEEAAFDPLDHYGLDDDPPVRLKRDGRRARWATT